MNLNGQAKCFNNNFGSNKECLLFGIEVEVISGNFFFFTVMVKRTVIDYEQSDT